MDLGKLSYYSRKIHRVSLWFVVILGLIQMVTGLTMKYPNLFAFFDQGEIRILHFQNAGYFSVAFGLQMLTGLILYATPWLLKLRIRGGNPPKV